LFPVRAEPLLSFASRFADCHVGIYSQSQRHAIVAAGAPTLGSVYANLTGSADGFAQFMNAVFDSNGNPVVWPISSDNIFST
jgi:hypothetical protein